jgi:hypothetical protein
MGFSSGQQAEIAVAQAIAGMKCGWMSYARGVSNK